MRFTRTLLTSAAVANAAAHGGVTAIGLSGDKTLVTIDSSTATVSGSMEVTGVDRPLGIDLRPATGQLIGVTDAFEVVEIDPAIGAVTVISTMDTPLSLMDGTPVIVDFNPAADRLRFMSGTTNHRVTVDTGEVIVDGSLAFEEAEMHSGEEPYIIAASYINSFGQPEGTAMFDIDATIVALIQQISPNDGTLAAIG